MAPRFERSLKHQQYAISYKNVFSIKWNQTWDNELSWVSTEGSDHADAGMNKAYHLNEIPFWQVTIMKLSLVLLVTDLSPLKSKLHVFLLLTRHF